MNALLSTAIARTPRLLLWTAAVIALLALITIIVVQIMTITLTTRPPTMTRWLTGIFVISSQAIFAAIALAISAFALHATGARGRVVAHVSSPIGTAPEGPTFESAPALSTRPVEPEPKLPASLQAAIAAANDPKKRRS